MKKVEEKALRSVLTVLDSLGAIYRIVDRDGNEYRTLPDARALPAKRQSRVHLYAEYLDPLKVGDVVTVPATDEVNIGHLQALCSAYMTRTFGAGSHTSARNPDGSLDVMRVK